MILKIGKGVPLNATFFVLLHLFKVVSFDFLCFLSLQSTRLLSEMDFTLRCNALNCRTQLTERAVVTTCRCEHPENMIAVN